MNTTVDPIIDTCNKTNCIREQYKNAANQSIIISAVEKPKLKISETGRPARCYIFDSLSGMIVAECNM